MKQRETHRHSEQTVAAKCFVVGGGWIGHLEFTDAN